MLQEQVLYIWLLTGFIATIKMCKDYEKKFMTDYEECYHEVHRVFTITAIFKQLSISLKCVFKTDMA